MDRVVRAQPGLSGIGGIAGSVRHHSECRLCNGNATEVCQKEDRTFVWGEVVLFGSFLRARATRRRLCGGATTTLCRKPQRSRQG